MLDALTYEPGASGTGTSSTRRPSKPGVLVCIYCQAGVARDPAEAMHCPSCNAKRGEPCGFCGKQTETHDAREAMALYYGFSKRCPARRGTEAHHFRAADVVAPQPAQMEMFGGEAA